jgi:thiol-disulfide isomerase/thioredoxin
MRKVFLIVGISFASLSFAQPTASRITGVVNNYNPTENNRFITFRTYDFRGRPKDTAVYIDRGKFSVELQQQFSGDIAIMYNDLYGTLLLFQGKSLHVEIDERQVAGSNDFSRAMRLEGPSANISWQLMKFETALNKKRNELKDLQQIIDDKLFSTKRRAQMKAEWVFADSYFSDKNISDNELKKWIKNNIAYEAGGDIVFHCFAGKRNTSLNDREFIELLQDIPLENKTSLKNASYFNFLSLFAGGIQIMVNINPQYEELRRTNGMNAIPVYLDKIDQYANGITKQFLYYHVFVTNPLIKTDPYYERFDHAVSDSDLKRMLQKNKEEKVISFQPFNLLQKLEKYPVDRDLKDRLFSIFQDRKDSYLFLDFWGSWCGPCMREMPIFPKLIDSLKEESIRFIFFAVETPAEKISSTEANFPKHVDFISLNPAEVKILNNLLQFNSYPSHFILAPGCHVVDRPTMKISSGNDLNQHALNEIRKSLKKPIKYP